MIGELITEGIRRRISSRGVKDSTVASPNMAELLELVKQAVAEKPAPKPVSEPQRPKPVITQPKPVVAEPVSTDEDDLVDDFLADLIK